MIVKRKMCKCVGWVVGIGGEGDESLQRKEGIQNRKDKKMVLYLCSQNGITLPPNLI